MADLADLFAPVLHALGLAGPVLQPSSMTPPPQQTAANTQTIPQQPSAAGAPQAGSAAPAGNPLPTAAPPAAPPPEQGFGAKATNFLENPLLQGALGAYLGTIGSPKSEGWGHAIASGGLTGLNAFNVAEQGKTMRPYEAAQIQRAQAEGSLATQQAKAMQQQVPDELLAKLDHARAMADPVKDPYAANFYDSLESAARIPPGAGGMSAKEVVAAMEKFDDSKRLMEAMHAQSYQQNAAMGPAMMWMATHPGQPLPPEMSAVMAASGGAGATPMPPTVPNSPASATPNIVDGKMSVPGRGELPAQVGSDGKTYVFDGGKWQSIP